MPAIPIAFSPGQNHLLASLPQAEFDALAPHLEWVAMPLGQVLSEPGAQMRHAYFPTTAIVSLLYVGESGASTETASVGNEGVVGISLFMGGNTTSTTAMVRTGGHGYRMDRHRLKEAFDTPGPLQRLLLLYTQALATQLMQNAACNRHHALEQQLCRWLLLTHDRAPGAELVITQELVASLLGVRREGVTEAAGNLQRAGLISYRRGHIAVLDRIGLQARSCECYGVVRKEMTRLMGERRGRDERVAVAA
jgi:CRP-like cAMP-binding protein